MARGKYFTDFERDLIRVGVKLGKNAAEIARAMGRTDTGVRNQIKAMQDAGTIGNLPFEVVQDRDTEALKNGR